MRVKAPKYILNRRAHIPNNQPPPRPLLFRLDWKFWVPLALAVVGVWLTVVTLESKLSVSLDTPLDPADVLTTPVGITNEGTFTIRGVDVSAFMLKTKVSGVVFTDSGAGGYIPPAGAIQAGHKQTVPFGTFISYPKNELGDFDIAMIVSYRPAWFWPFHTTEYFRLVGAKQSDGLWRMQEQPSGDTEERYKSFIGRLPKVNH